MRAQKKVSPPGGFLLTNFFHGIKIPSFEETFESGFEQKSKAKLYKGREDYEESIQKTPNFCYRFAF